MRLSWCIFFFTSTNKHISYYLISVRKLYWFYLERLFKVNNVHDIVSSVSRTFQRRGWHFLKFNLFLLIHFAFPWSGGRGASEKNVKMSFYTKIQVLCFKISYEDPFRSNSKPPRPSSPWTRPDYRYFSECPMLITQLLFYFWHLHNVT